MSLCSCSEVFVRVGGVKSQPFTVDVGFWQGCVLSPPLFIVYMNWIDSNSRVDEGVTVLSRRINRCRIKLFRSAFLLRVSPRQGLQHALVRFSSVCDQARMKISTEIIELLLLSIQPSQCIGCKHAPTHCSSTLGWYSWVLEDGTRGLIHRLVHARRKGRKSGQGPWILKFDIFLLHF